MMIGRAVLSILSWLGDRRPIVSRRTYADRNNERVLVHVLVGDSAAGGLLGLPFRRVRCDQRPRPRQGQRRAGRDAPCTSKAGKRGCEQKVTLRCVPVHSPFTPAGLILMADIVQLTFGGQLAPARR